MKADHLIVRRRGYTHHAVDLGDGYVVQYGRGVTDAARASVQITPRATFAKGRPVEQGTSPCAFPPEDVVRRALSRVGEREYHLLWNNCEHFVTWCRSGRRVSRQTERFVTAAGIASKLALSAGTAAATKLVGKVAPKPVARALATRWLWAATGAQYLAETAATAWGCEQKIARRTGRVVGAGTSAVIGGLAGGPAGAAAAVGTWTVAELLEHGLSCVAGEKPSDRIPAAETSPFR